jgi:hypothetical protein
MKQLGAALLVLAMAAVACSTATPTPQTIIEVAQQTVEVPVTIEVTREVEVEVTQIVTEIVEITRLVPVTVTPPPTPLMSATPSNTPTITPTPTDTPLPTSTPNRMQTATAEAFAALIEPKGDGFYLVNVDITPGIWRSTGSQDDCYWSVTQADGDIMDNHFGMAGGTAYISPSAFQVEFNDCGRWEYIGPP